MLTDGTLACWGWNGVGQATPPSGTFTAVSAGTHHTCAIRIDGTVHCWGANGVGQTAAPAGTFMSVTAGGGHTCAIRSDATLACWGWNVLGQAPPPSGTFIAVSAGGQHTCGIRSDATLACWGWNVLGQAPPPSGTFIAVSAGDQHTCGIRSDATLACWGNDNSGEATPPEGTFAAISAGSGHTCGIRTDKTLSCWGNDVGGSRQPAGLFTDVDTNVYHSCAIGADSRLTCWGRNDNGQLTPLPTAAIATLPLWRATTAVRLAWSGTATLARIASFDIRYRRARWSGGFGPWVTWRSATTATSATFTGSPGYTYCFSVQARDADGGVSGWTPETCTAVPLDDRSMTRSLGWSAGTGQAFYRATFLRSSAYKAKLTKNGVVSRRIALVATTCPTCGTVKVYWGTTLLKTVSLYAVTRVNKSLITVKTFTSVRSGTLKIKVVSSGKKVIIDGVAISRN